MLTIEMDLDTLETLLALLNALETRTPMQEMARATLQDAYDNAAEQYWTDKWNM